MSNQNLPTKLEVLKILREHPLVKLNGDVLGIWIVGSYAKGYATERSDIDILLKVRKRNITTKELEEKYRLKIIKHFTKNNIRTIADKEHPNWNGKRLDIYFTYDERKEDCIKL